MPNKLPGNGRRPMAYWHRHKKEILAKFSSFFHKIASCHHFKGFTKISRSTNRRRNWRRPTTRAWNLHANKERDRRSFLQTAQTTDKNWTSFWPRILTKTNLACRKKLPLKLRLQSQPITVHPFLQIQTSDITKSLFIGRKGASFKWHLPFRVEIEKN